MRTIRAATLARHVGHRERRRYWRKESAITLSLSERGRRSAQAQVTVEAVRNGGSEKRSEVRKQNRPVSGLRYAIGARTIAPPCGPFAEGNLSALIARGLNFRDSRSGPVLRHGVGSEAWDRLFGPPRPKELHPFREIRAGRRHAVSTPGDLMFHIRAKRMDLCFELATQIMARIGDAVRRSTRCTASATSTTAISWASSTDGKSARARR
jgi:hypothetical protein